MASRDRLTKQLLRSVYVIDVPLAKWAFCERIRNAAVSPKVVLPVGNFAALLFGFLVLIMRACFAFGIAKLLPLRGSGLAISACRLTQLQAYRLGGYPSTWWDRESRLSTAAIDKAAFDADSIACRAGFIRHSRAIF